MTDLTPIAHNKPWILPQDLEAVSSSLASGWLAPGPQTQRFEEAFCRLQGGGSACAVSSGSAALYGALLAFGIGKGKRVALPTYVCTAVLNAVTLCGAEPVLVDIRDDTFNIDPQALAALPAKPDAVIAVHTYGAAADIAVLKRLAPVVIEDCCQSLAGSASDGQMLGRAGDASVFSFYATKIITSGHGGLVYGANGDVAARVRDLIMFDGRETWKPRFNFQMTDFQAALARAQLSRIDAIAARRRELAAAYRAALAGRCRVQGGLEGGGAMPYRFVVRTPDRAARDVFRDHMQERGIFTIVPLDTGELLHRQLSLAPGAFPAAERVCATTVSIPLYPALTATEESRILDALDKAPKI